MLRRWPKVVHPVLLLLRDHGTQCTPSRCATTHRQPMIKQTAATHLQTARLLLLVGRPLIAFCALLAAEPPQAGPQAAPAPPPPAPGQLLLGRLQLRHGALQGHPWLKGVQLQGATCKRTHAHWCNPPSTPLPNQ